MNIRKPTDYAAMLAALDTAVAAQLPQMELYCEIGRVVSGRAEKGAAVAASEYLQAAYPAAEGFSPRNLRRMRDFYRMYGDTPELLAAAMRLNWTQNVVIMEAKLTVDERCWYIRKATESGLSKTELLRMIERAEHSKIALGENEDTCYTVENDEFSEKNQYEEYPVYLPRQHLPQPDGGVCDEGLGQKKLGLLHDSISSQRPPAGRRSATRSILRRSASWRSMGSPATATRRGSLPIRITTNTTC
mgnify:CR=1 FL=1